MFGVKNGRNSFLIRHATHSDPQAHSDPQGYPWYASNTYRTSSFKNVQEVIVFPAQDFFLLTVPEVYSKKNTPTSWNRLQESELISLDASDSR